MFLPRLGFKHVSCSCTPQKSKDEWFCAPVSQQIGDDSRGWAWTRALQGLPANEIHLCGDGSALPLVRSLARAMEEEVEVCPCIKKGAGYWFFPRTGLLLECDASSTHRSALT
jgi:hypothetical protein